MDSKRKIASKIIRLDDRADKMVRRILFLLAIALISTTFTSCQWLGSKTVFTYFAISAEAVRLAPDSPKHPIFVEITYETTNEIDETETIQLAAGSLGDGDIEFKEQVTESIEVLIKVSELPERYSASTKAILRPNSTINLQYRRSNYDTEFGELIFEGVHDLSLEPNRRFSFTGDRRSLSEGFFDMSVVRAYSDVDTLDESDTVQHFGPLFFEDGEFLIVGDVEEPTLFTIEISRPFEFLAQQHFAIFEPGVNYRLVPLGNSGEIAIEADRESTHTKLISSWQRDPAYIEIVEQLIQAQKDEFNSNGKRHAQHLEEFVTNYKVAAECEHIVVTKTQLSPLVTDYIPSSLLVRTELVRLRSAALRKLMDETTNFKLSELISTLGSKMLDEDSAWGLNVRYERETFFLQWWLNRGLETSNGDVQKRLDRNRVLQEEIWSTQLSEQKSQQSLPGQIAPAFLLPTSSGEKVDLNDLLQDNKFVFIDFWASWCGPCIDSFPELKKVYSTFHERGLEIVSISIDSDYEDWEQGLVDNDLPWVNLVAAAEDGELWGWTAPTALAYGLNFIPQGFLVDEHGCIVKKNVSMNKLKRFLGSNLRD